ncbi:MAG: nucleotidyltransferase domain-containing protein [Candidatus Delongbacteria bacterium]|nr:nucleotidyltransferase domain-containing protein [Candidatus Delongbacteria bacterium]MBN2836398.1 nucleotidyltransferase domain-containing protein [Candidatus Delongbacteria bacterium]
MSDLYQIYNEVANSFIERLKKDKNIIAVILTGSMITKQIWNKSDIDLIIISDKEINLKNGLIIESGINFDINCYVRISFKTMMEKSLPDSVNKMKVNKGKLVFCRDKGLEKIITEYQLDFHERQLLMLREFGIISSMLMKAKKNLAINCDVEESYFYLSAYIVEHVSNLILLINSKDLEYEYKAIYAAKKIEPNLISEIFQANYLCEVSTIEKALKGIEMYLDKNLRIVYQPLLDYCLKRSNDLDFIEAVEEYKTQYSDHISIDLDWLVEKKILLRTENPTLLSWGSKLEINYKNYHIINND